MKREVSCLDSRLTNFRFTFFPAYKVHGDWSLLRKRMRVAYLGDPLLRIGAQNIVGLCEGTCMHAEITVRVPRHSNSWSVPLICSHKQPWHVFSGVKWGRSYLEIVELKSMRENYQRLSANYVFPVFSDADMKTYGHIHLDDIVQSQRSQQSPITSDSSLA